MKRFIEVPALPFSFVGVLLIILLALSSCRTVRKTMSESEQQEDSSGVTVIAELKLQAIDSAWKAIAIQQQAEQSDSSYEKRVEEYTSVWTSPGYIDSSVGKLPVYIPAGTLVTTTRKTTTEKGRKKTESTKKDTTASGGQLKKTDTSRRSLSASADVKTFTSASNKDVSRKSLIWWPWLIVILVAAVFWWKRAWLKGRWLAIKKLFT